MTRPGEKLLRAHIFAFNYYPILPGLNKYELDNLKA